MKQHTNPLIIQGNQSTHLKKISLKDRSYNEGWIQQLCYNHPNSLPINEFEPSFANNISICQELTTPSGSCDLIYLNENGFITIGECKLWRNPEARRKVVGQILDYAKDIAQWNYQQFETACLKARNKDETSLFEIVQAYFPDLEEHEFIDSVQNNLSRGRFLLLIIGDGIRENMEELVDYLQSYNQLNFTFALIEMPVYENPKNNDLIVTPRILAKTKEIERTIFHIIEKDEIEGKPELIDERSKSISEKDFYERLATNKNQQVADQLEQFINNLVAEYKFIPKIGRGKRKSLNIKSPDNNYNFASIQESGEVWFYAIVSKADELGERQIGVDYLQSLANIIQAELDNKPNDWYWGIKRNGQFVSIDEYLQHQNKWRALIENTLKRIWEIEEE